MNILFTSQRLSIFFHHPMFSFTNVELIDEKNGICPALSFSLALYKTQG